MTENQENDHNDSPINDSPLNRTPRATPAQRWVQPQVRQPTGRRWRRTLLITVAVASAVAVVAGQSVAAASAGAVPAVQGDPVQTVPDAPGLQRWLKQREALQIELNNAIVAVLKLDPAVRKPGQAPCVRLAKATAALNAVNIAPSTDVESLGRVGLNRFTDGARTCLTGDIPHAITTVQAGLDERAAATDALDHALTGH